MDSRGGSRECNRLIVYVEPSSGSKPPSIRLALEYEIPRMEFLVERLNKDDGTVMSKFRQTKPGGLSIDTKDLTSGLEEWPECCDQTRFYQIPTVVRQEFVHRDDFHCRRDHLRLVMHNYLRQHEQSTQLLGTQPVFTSVYKN